MRENITIGEFAEHLNKMPVAQIRAILFALEQGIEIEVAVFLRWRDVLLQEPLTPLARQCVLAQPHRIGCQYVFWHEDELGRPAPMQGLRSRLFAAFGVEWWELRHIYATATWVDIGADLHRVIALPGDPEAI